MVAHLSMAELGISEADDLATLKDGDPPVSIQDFEVDPRTPIAHSHDNLNRAPRHDNLNRAPSIPQNVPIPKVS